MFERFTDRARLVVTGAQEHGRRLGHPYIGTEHMLLALSDGDGVSARVLDRVGFDRGRFQRAVLDEIGSTFAPPQGDLPFTPRVKKALSQSLGQSMSMGHDYIGTEHLLLGLLEDDSSLATKLAAEQGIAATKVRAAVIQVLVGTQDTSGRGRPAAVPEAAERTVPVDATDTTDTTDTTEALDGHTTAKPSPAAPPELAAAHCPGCLAPLAPNLGADVITSVGDIERPFTVTYCRACGHLLALFPDQQG
jgi:ATP-dependent Clp protease ATP-binding subunit ClpC